MSALYQKMSMAQYLSLPAVSVSILRAMVDDCPHAAWWDSWLNPNRPVEAHTQGSDAGTIAHAILLEGSNDIVTVIDPEDHPNEKGGGIPQGWTNKAIRAARDAARMEGKIPVLKSAMSSINDMVGSAHDFIESLKTQEPAIWALFQPDGGDSEVTLTWKESDTTCRIRPDRISKDRTLIVDYKTTEGSSNPSAWARTQFYPKAHYMSAAFYRKGVEASFGAVSDYVFLVQSQEEPYRCSLVGVDPSTLALGEEKIRVALEQWAQCVQSCSFPAYPNRVCYPTLPAWEMTGWEDRRMSIEKMEEFASQA